MRFDFSKSKGIRYCDFLFASAYLARTSPSVGEESSQVSPTGGIFGTASNDVLSLEETHTLYPTYIITFGGTVGRHTAYLINTLEQKSQQKEAVEYTSSLQGYIASCKDPEMACLKDAVRSGDEAYFLRTLRSINWQHRSPEDYIAVTRMALQIGAHLAARRLATEGSERYPDNAELKNYACVLAPPKVIRSYGPSDLTVDRNRDWLKENRDKFQGQWVALRNGELLGTAYSLKELTSKLADTKGILLTRV